MTAQKLIRVNLYHLFSATQAIASGKIDASINARGLDGEAYRGHVFWDEMFDLPLLTLYDPQLVRQLLMYRYRRLPAAKRTPMRPDLLVPCSLGSPVQLGMNNPRWST